MKTIGFPISHKENESRRAIVPEHIKFLDKPEYLYIENGYGNVLGIGDEDYANLGCHMVSRSKVLEADVIVDPKCDLWDDVLPDDFTNWNQEEEEYSTTLRHGCRLMLYFDYPLMGV